jgi:hypothetical protein
MVCRRKLRSRGTCTRSVRAICKIAAIASILVQREERRTAAPKLHELRPVRRHHRIAAVTDRERKTTPARADDRQGRIARERARAASVEDRNTSGFWPVAAETSGPCRRPRYAALHRRRTPSPPSGGNAAAAQRRRGRLRSSPLRPRTGATPPRVQTRRPPFVTTSIAAATGCRRTRAALLRLPRRVEAVVAASRTNRRRAGRRG